MTYKLTTNQLVERAKKVCSAAKMPLHIDEIRRRIAKQLTKEEGKWEYSGQRPLASLLRGLIEFRELQPDVFDYNRMRQISKRTRLREHVKGYGRMGTRKYFNRHWC